MSRQVSDIRVVAGFGLTGILPLIGCRSSWETTVRSGRESRDRAVARGDLEDAESRGLPLTLIGWGNRARGLFVFEEEWRPAAEAVLSYLAGQNSMLRS